MAGVADFFGGAGTSLLGDIFSLGIGAVNRELNYQTNERAAQNADKRQRALIEDYQTPSAQMRMLKEAGLSPSLYYGNTGGVSGISAAQGEGANGMNTQTYGVNPLIAAQIENVKADTELKTAEAENKTKDTERIEADTARIWADAGAKEASMKLTQAQTNWQNLQNNIINDTYTSQVWKIKSEARKTADEAQSAYWEAENAGLQFRFNLENYQTELNKSRQELANMIQSEELSKAECNRIANAIQTMWIEALASEENAEANTKNAEAYANYVEAFSDNLPKQLELRSKELNVEKWKIGVGAVTETMRTIGYFLGAQQLGDGGTTTTQTSTDYNNKGKPTHTRQTTTKVQRLPKIR